jgi:hypothetical protein
VYDAIVELATNSDDRYQVLGVSGKIEIEIERTRNKRHLLKVRDFADGMDSATMEKKLSWMGGRESGLDKGACVRGTHSRGAKDVAAVGDISFESIAHDGRYHKCHITRYLDFVPPVCAEADDATRKRIGIKKGTGTLVTIEVDNTQQVPHHDNIKDQLQRLIYLRGILKDPSREVVLVDSARGRKDVLRAPSIEGNERVKETFDVPGYPGVSAKLSIFRAKERFEKESEKFRQGGILIESRRAIHQATLFDSSLENDVHAQRFYGRLRCEHIDDLCNDFDERFENKLPHPPQNPCPLIDPSRRGGLMREHPFTKALFSEALKRLRPLVEEERRQEEKDRASIENQATKKRLRLLEKAAVDFMKDFGEDDDVSIDQSAGHPASGFTEKGYAISPPFTQMVVGHSERYRLLVRRDVFPGIENGATVQVECLSDDIEVDTRICGLEPDPSRDGFLRALWKVKALKKCPATGVKARVDAIVADAVIEVLGSEAEKYEHIKTLSFNRKSYRVVNDGRKKTVRLLAPISLVPTPQKVAIHSTSQSFEILSDRMLIPRPELGVAICNLTVRSKKEKEDCAQLVAVLGEDKAVADLMSVTDLGAGLVIKIEDVDYENQRYKFQQNVLTIAARHPSLRRYLGAKEQGFPGQESKHFRILIAEIVSDAVCAKLVGRDESNRRDDYEKADWDQYYFFFSKLMTRFLPIAHKLQYPDPSA